MRRSKPDKRKFERFACGQLDVREELKRIKAQIPNPNSQIPRVWMHAASLGEAAIARPLIMELRRRMKVEVALTFFSPSGYEVVSKKPYSDGHVLYLPLDTRRNVRQFLDTVRPDMALFMVSEYWYNYLHELRRRRIPTYLISAKITETSIFGRPYGFLHRKCLACYRHIFVLDEESRRRLNSFGAQQVSVSGNPLFDNAISKARMEWSHPVLDAFCRSRNDVFIAGSVHDEQDAILVSALVNSRPDGKFIIVPHDVTPDSLAAICSRIDSKAVFLTKATPEEAANVSTLIVDTVGSLAFIYRYGAMAYIGGGFTSLLHSVIEATAYGLPASFGPRIHRKVTPAQLVERGIGTIVNSPEDLINWYDGLLKDPETLPRLNKVAKEYVGENVGSTAHIVTQILEMSRLCD